MRCFHLFVAGAKEFYKEWSRIVRAALEFRMELNSNMEVSGNLYGFYKSFVRRSSADDKTSLLHFAAVVVVELVAVAMTLADV